MKAVKIAALTLVLVVAFVGIRLTQQPDSATVPDSRAAVEQHHAPAAPVSQGPSVLQAHSTADPVARLAATSLKGTQPPADLSTDSDGNLIANPGCKDLLDYFLALTGEMSNDDIRQLIHDWATQQVGTKAADQLLDVLDRYQRFEKVFASGEFAADGAEDVRQKMAMRRQVRDDILGADLSAALFANDDAYDDFSLQRADIMKSSRSAEEKQQAVDNLIATLPPVLAQQYRRQEALDHLPEKEQSLREAGADDADIYAWRSQTFGDDAAQRLAALDQQRAAWDSRYQQYAVERDRILSAGLSEQDQQNEIAQLRTRLFNDTEQLRVAALDRIHSAAQ